MVVNTVGLDGRLAHNPPVRAKSKQRQLRETRCRSKWHGGNVIERLVHNLVERTYKPTSTVPAAANEFTKAILEAEQVLLPEETQIPRVCEMV